MNGPRAWRTRLDSTFRRVRWALWIVGREAAWRRGLVAGPTVALVAAAGFALHTLPRGGSRLPSEAVIQLVGVCACLFAAWQSLRDNGTKIRVVLTEKQSKDDRDGVMVLVGVRALLVGVQLTTCVAAGALLAGMLNDAWGYAAGVTFPDAGATDNWLYSGLFAVVVGALAIYRCARETNN